VSRRVQVLRWRSRAFLNADARNRHAMHWTRLNTCGRLPSGTMQQSSKGTIHVPTGWYRRRIGPASDQTEELGTTMRTDRTIQVQGDK
jgi:hypothetical protein